MTKEEAVQALKAWREAPSPRDVAEYERLDAQLLAACGLSDEGSDQSDRAAVEYFSLWLSAMGTPPKLSYPAAKPE